MLSPVGPYFKSGFQPVDLLVDPKYIRAWPGGTGDVKCGGNYGPTIPLQKQAADESGCTQVMWLFNDGEGSPLMTEVGTMNFMMVWNRPEDGELQSRGAHIRTLHYCDPLSCVRRISCARRTHAARRGRRTAVE